MSEMVFFVKVSEDPNGVFDGVIASEGENMTLERYSALIDDDNPEATKRGLTERGIGCYEMMVGDEMTAAMVEVRLAR